MDKGGIASAAGQQVQYWVSHFRIGSPECLLSVGDGVSAKMGFFCLVPSSLCYVLSPSVHLPIVVITLLSLHSCTQNHTDKYTKPLKREPGLKHHAGVPFFFIQLIKPVRSLKLHLPQSISCLLAED